LDYVKRRDAVATIVGFGPAEDSAMNKSPRNRTLELRPHDVERLRSRLFRPDKAGHGFDATAVLNRVICADVLRVTPQFPNAFVDLLVLDPPYNLDKAFGSTPDVRQQFRKADQCSYGEWVETWFPPLLRLLKPTATVYFCGDWRSSAAVVDVLDRHLKVRNRITWEREKGRGALRNWKNASEDVWFATVGDEYTFNVEAVKLKRRVLAPYRDASGKPKDWADGYRLTHPSNLWTDLTVPFWSMPENTPHPTQKPEKLMAKLILASSCPGDVVLDPFLGSGTTAVVAHKLNRAFVGVDLDEGYCCTALRRLELAELDRTIQGYSDRVFYERNSQPAHDASRPAGQAHRGIPRSRSAAQESLL
jgi:site-specific DNA-methyltransferase (adenine-specific)